MALLRYNFDSLGDIYLPVESCQRPPEYIIPSFFQISMEFFIICSLYYPLRSIPLSLQSPPVSSSPLFPLSCLRSHPGFWYLTGPQRMRNQPAIRKKFKSNSLIRISTLTFPGKNLNGNDEQSNRGDKIER